MLVAVTIVASMRVVGILLVAALMVLPVASAQVLARSQLATLGWSVVIGLASVVAGLSAAYWWGLAPGGTIVLGGGGHLRRGGGRRRDATAAGRASPAGQGQPCSPGWTTLLRPACERSASATSANAGRWSSSSPTLATPARTPTSSSSTPPWPRARSTTTWPCWSTPGWSAVVSDDFARYELAEDLTEHHHHLICSACGSIEDFTASPQVERTVARAISEVSGSTGFTPEHHRLDLIGVCAECA